MRIHTTTATSRDIVAAASQAGVYLERFTSHGSRTHAQAFDLILSGEASHRINSGEFGHAYGASWDQWGIFLASIYAVDDSAKSWAYKHAEDFHYKTGFRFDADETDAVTSTGSPAYRRTSHRWQYENGRTTCSGHGKTNPTCTATLNR